jgi:protein subunit release factor A
LFSVTIKDCDVESFTVGGAGGGGKDTANTGCRITHRASGAQGKATDTRSWQKNRILAFGRMARSKVFQDWHKIECARRLGQAVSIENTLDDLMLDKNLKIEYI